MIGGVVLLVDGVLILVVIVMIVIEGLWGILVFFECFGND